MSNKQPPRLVVDLGFKPVMSLREISEETGISESNVSYLLQNAQKKIRAYLKMRGITMDDLLEQ